MFNRKIFMGIFIALTVCLSACKNSEPDITETSEETVTTTEETPSAPAENTPDVLTICGNEYGAEDIYIEIDGDILTETDMENIRRMERLSAVSVENPNVSLVEMFAENPDITKIELVKFDGDISEYLNALKGFEIIVIDAVNYSAKDSALIYGALSDSSVRYEKNSDRLSDLPTEGIALSTSVCVLPNGESNFDTYWTLPDVLNIGIDNFTDKAQTVQRLELFYESENGDEAVIFKNGESILTPDITVEKRGEAEFSVDKNMLDYQNAKTGIYKIRLTFENDTAEAEFVIANSDGSEFFTEEQREMLDKTCELSEKYSYDLWINSYCWENPKEQTDISDESVKTLCECYTYDYVVNHTDRFRINGDGSLNDVSGDRGGSYVYMGTLFSPISVSGEQVDFKTTVINFHGDNPYFVWFEELNYHMVKTEEGWRFDKFQLWY